MQFIFKLVIVLVPVIAFLFYYTQIKKTSLLILGVLYLVSIVAYSLFSIGKYIYLNYPKPPEWDFLVFWMDGNVASSGNDFYKAESYQQVQLPYSPSEGFRNEIINVGFKYPPFTIFLFVPLALFEIGRAYLVWQTVNLLLCFAIIYGLWRLFLKDYGVVGLLLIAALFLLLPPVHSTFSFAQTNFFAMLFFLMFWQNRSKGLGGIWLALCVVVKPYMALLYIYPILARKWKMFGIAVLSLLMITILSVIAFGPGVLISFFSNSVSKVPPSLYTESINQSLLATILRYTKYQTASGSPLLNPIYLETSLTLTFLTVLLTIRERGNNSDWIVLSILLLALIVYPATLEHYSIFLIVPVVLLLQQSSQSMPGRMAILFIIFIVYFLSGYKDGSYTFFANIFTWFVCMVLGANLNLDNLLHSSLEEKPTT